MITLSDYGVVCSYDELKRFRASAAIENTRKITANLRSYLEGLIQGITDNFDVTIASQNGIKQTHSLALMLAQHCSVDGQAQDQEFDIFPKVKKADIKNLQFPDVPIQNYPGTKKPNKPNKQP